MPELFQRLPRNVIVIFSGRNLLWHALAIVLTMLIVMSGFDWSYYLSTRGDSIRALAWPAIMLGSAAPVFGTLLLMIVGEAGRNSRIITTKTPSKSFPFSAPVPAPIRLAAIPSRWLSD
jgi:TRAP-type C4-dicarboxylate transport system permease small subunit